MQKLRVYHFSNGTGGGAFSVIKNLLQFSANDTIENHIIYTINKDIVPYFQLNHTVGAITEQVFYYSASWNFYHTCRQLSKYLPDNKALIVASDWLELGMVSNLGLQNKVIHILHGDYDYYYTLATIHAAAVDTYITVAADIKKKLTTILPYRKEDIHYQRFPVPESICNDTTYRQANSIIFIGRCTEDKGYPLLPTIAKLLDAQQSKLQWHIVGELKNKQQYPWDPSTAVIFHGLISNEAVYELLCQVQLFILPSIAEGMPVSLIESMKAGVIPVVNNLPGGIQELVSNDETGFTIDSNHTQGYVEAIKTILRDNATATRLSGKCRSLAAEMFNPVANTNLFEGIYLQTAKKQSLEKPVKKVYGSRLDQVWLGNTLTSLVRKIFKKR